MKKTFNVNCHIQVDAAIYNDSLEGSSTKPGRSKRSLHPQILEESDNDF